MNALGPLLAAAAPPRGVLIDGNADQVCASGSYCSHLARAPQREHPPSTTGVPSTTTSGKPARALAMTARWLQVPDEGSYSSEDATYGATPSAPPVTSTLPVPSSTCWWM